MTFLDPLGLGIKNDPNWGLKIWDPLGLSLKNDPNWGLKIWDPWLGVGCKKMTPGVGNFLGPLGVEFKK